MAKKRKSSSRSGSNTLFILLLGLILGLGVAVAVAIFVTQAPMPFMDKASREPPQTLLPDVRNAPDPNQALYGKNGKIDQLAPAPEPGTGSAPPHPDSIRSGDHIGDLIATLGRGGSSSETSPRSGPTSPLVVPGVTEPSSENTVTRSGTQTPYFLQAGAFRSESDAESIKARVLLIGLPAEIQTAQVGGSTIHRVRVGPFTGIDDMNRARSQLGAEKIESAVVRP